MVTNGVCILICAVVFFFGAACGSIVGIKANKMLEEENYKLRQEIKHKEQQIKSVRGEANLNKLDLLNLKRKTKENIARANYNFAQLIKSKMDNVFIQKLGVEYVYFLKKLVDDTLKEIGENKYNEK